ncbi:MAG TPA: ISNCY family transposase [Candidatus Acidoferrales bacterium]|nr:ISNCY family transposase [Candidatus Acidoferrales bacterium]
MGNNGRWEYLRAIYERYRVAGRKAKKVILSEFCANTGYHRKYAIRLLNGPRPEKRRTRRGRRRGLTYSQETLALLTAVWEAAGYPWSVRLKALLPTWLPWIRKRFRVRPEIEPQLLQISARQIDRRLKAQKTQRKRSLYGRTKPGYLLKHHIPVKADGWDVQNPGFTEVDLVSHSGNSASGEFGHPLNVTDIHTTWTESQAVLGRGEEAVQRALNEIAGVLPFPLRGVDSDNGSEFINWHLQRWCEQKGIQLTRGRPYKKDDNAHVEQKNWTHVRKLLGWERYDTHEAVEAINDLYRHELRLWLNLFLPSVKLVKKVRLGSKVRRIYDAPRTPLERVKAGPQANPEKVARLEQFRKALDPFQLGRSIERKLDRIYRLANRRLSQKAVQQTPAEPGPRVQRANGCGKAAALGNPANHARFPLSHSRNHNKPSVTFQMSRQPLLRLHS